MSALEMDIPILPAGAKNAADMIRIAAERHKRLMQGPAVKPPPRPTLAIEEAAKRDMQIVNRRAMKHERDWLPIATPDFGEPAPIVRTCPPTPQEVIEAVCRHFRIGRERLVSKKRDEDICYARRIAMYLAVKLCAEDSAGLGRAFRRDRSTVLQMAKALKLTLDSDPELIPEVEKLWDALEGPIS